MVLSKKYSLLFPIAILLFLWGIVIVFVNPVGEFMVNDDWSFTTIVEAFLSGKQIHSTGWGEGGPSVFSHIGWGLLFSALLGYSVTTLRISVLVLAIFASIAFLVLLRQMGLSRWLALWATLILIFNPLFLSQSFTFMTDITFVSIFLFSFLFLHMGVEQKHQPVFILGLFFALLSVLTRQIGLVLPLALMMTYPFYAQHKPFSVKKVILLTVFITIVPWLCYEFFLAMSGSTPVTSHPVVRKIFTYPQTKGFPDYFLFLVSQAAILLLYTAFFASPLLVLQSNRLLQTKVVQKLVLFSVITFFLFEVCLMSGFIDPPIGFYRNIIYNFGIGPVLLKDSYLLGVQRTASLPKPIFYLFVFWSLLTTGALLYFIVNSCKQRLVDLMNKENEVICFTSSLALVSGFIYSGIILLTGFHDRYLIPISALIIIWFTSQIKANKGGSPFSSRLLSVTLLLFLASTSILGVKDFMTTKRSLHKAHQFLLEDLKVNPCDIDGGFEFNGYYCSGENSVKYGGEYSWWWVKSERYLVSLGPLPNYHIIKTFPFSRYIGHDGAIHILEPDKYE